MPTSNFSPSTFSAAEVERFKRDAKVIHRKTGVPHSQAVDQVAIRQGYVNWSRLMCKGAGPNSSQAPRPPEYRLVRSALEMKEAMRVRRGGEGPTPDELNDLTTRFVSPTNAVRYAIAYLELALAASRYSVNAKSIGYLEMRQHLPYRVHETGVEGKSLLVNRHYKPVGNNRPNEWVSYEGYPRMHFAFAEENAKLVSAPAHLTARALYGDGSRPWGARSDAVAYLERLRSLLAILTRGSGR